MSLALLLGVAPVEGVTTASGVRCDCFSPLQLIPLPIRFFLRASQLDQSRNCYHIGCQSQYPSGALHRVARYYCNIFSRRLGWTPLWATYVVVCSPLVSSAICSKPLLLYIPLQSLFSKKQKHTPSWPPQNTDTGMLMLWVRGRAKLSPMLRK